jgi:hypothetical protein
MLGNGHDSAKLVNVRDIATLGNVCHNATMLNAHHIAMLGYVR